MPKTTRTPTPVDRLLPMAEVMARTSFSKATVYRKISDGSFPAPRKIGKSRVAWLEAESRNGSGDEAAPSSTPANTPPDETKALASSARRGLRNVAFSSVEPRPGRRTWLN